MASLRKLLSAPLVYLPLLLALVVTLYAAIGFWGVPRLIHAQATSYARDELHRELTLGPIRFNPFTFELDVRDATLREQGTPVLGFQHLHANYQALSIFTRTQHWREVSLDRPYARAIIRPDGSLDLADLLPESDPNEPLPDLLIEQLSVRDGKLDFADRSRRLKPTKTLLPVTFALHDFRTTQDGGEFRLDARTADGEGLAWQGRVSLAPLASKGQFDIKGLKARTVHAFFSEQLPLQLTGGSIDLDGRYTFAVKGRNGMQLDADLPKVSLKDLHLRARDVDTDWVQLPTATLDDTHLSLERREVTIKALRMSGLQAQVWLEPDGSINLGRLLPQRSNAGVASGAGAPEPEWTLQLADLDLDQAQVHLEDRTVKPVAKFELTSLSAHVGQLSRDRAKAMPVTMTATINGAAPLSLRGDVVPEPFGADLQLQIDRMPLRALATYLPDYPALELRSGEIGAKGKLVMRPEQAPGPALAYTGDASVSHVDWIEHANKRQFMSWERVDLAGIAYTTSPDSIAVRRITARKPFVRVTIAPDRTVNLATLLAATPTTAQATATKAIDATTSPPLKVGELVLDNGVMAFADLSIQPNFQARIEALRGRIADISTAPHSVAHLDLAGHVINRYSPVTIKGQANLLAYDERTDVAMTFRNIELPIFNPYSGRFAGYSIAKGKLTTELHYKIDHRQLVADHHVVIDQLQWGQATESKEKVTWPIRLATSLLKDTHGVIDLKLPVTGSLDDPRFRIGPIVWQIIKNILVKVVTAPFRWLGSLFKGAEDAQYVDFAPGSAELSDKARSALPALASSLSSRPEIRIDIPAGQVPEADVSALDDQRFQAAIAKLREGKRGAAKAYADLDDEDKIDVLKDLYRQQFGRRPEWPDGIEVPAPAVSASDPADNASVATTQGVDPSSEDQTKSDAITLNLVVDEPETDAPAPAAGIATAPGIADESTAPDPMNALLSAPSPAPRGRVGEGADDRDDANGAQAPRSDGNTATTSPPPKDLTRRERKASRRQAQVAWLEAELRPRFKADPSEGKALAHARAAAVQDALLADGKLDPTRVFLAGDLSPVAKEDVVRMELTLK